MAILSTLAAFVIFLAFAHRFKYSDLIPGAKPSRLRFCIAGFFSVAIPTLYKILVIGDPWILPLQLLLLVLLFFLGPRLGDALTTLLPLREQDVRAFFTPFPPKSRDDLVKVDMFLALLIAMPLIASAMH